MAKTIDEIARETGYSRTTITFVLKGKADQYRISAQAQAAIRDYVAEHGFTINHAARSLKLSRSDAVGFVAPDMTNAFFARLMAHLERHCRDNGLVLLSASTYEDPAIEQRALETLRERGVDGLVLAACATPDAAALSSGARRIPTVLVDRDYPAARLPTVASDHCAGAATIARALIARVPRGLVFLCGHKANPSIKARLRGFRQAVAAAAHPGVTPGATPGAAPAVATVVTSDDDSTAAGGAMMAQVLAASGEPPPAVLCSSLLVLEGALRHVREACGGVPPEMVIGTFDDHGLLEFLPNPVVLMRQDEAALADAAFDCLKAQLDGGPLPFRRRTLAMEIVRFRDRPDDGGDGGGDDRNSAS